MYGEYINGRISFAKGRMPRERFMAIAAALVEAVHLDAAEIGRSVPMEIAVEGHVPAWSGRHPLEGAAHRPKRVDVRKDPETRKFMKGLTKKECEPVNRFINKATEGKLRLHLGRTTFIRKNMVEEILKRRPIVGLGLFEIDGIGMGAFKKIAEIARKWPSL
jgi:hypothetical protein